MKKMPAFAADLTIEHLVRTQKRRGPIVRIIAQPKIGLRTIAKTCSGRRFPDNHT